MAGYITRAKEIVANIKNKDQAVPGNPFLKAVGDAYIYAYRSNWEAFIASPANTVTNNTPPVSTVVNPANPADPTDIGELDSDTRVFTPSSAGDIARLSAVHFIREQRRYNREILRNYRLLTTAITAGDAGETASDFRAGVIATANTESITELGDETNDPEA